MIKLKHTLLICLISFCLFLCFLVVVVVFIFWYRNLSYATFSLRCQYMIIVITLKIVGLHVFSQHNIDLEFT